MDREIRGSQFILPSNNEIKSIIILVCWNFDVLGQIKSIEEIEEIKSSAIVTIINSEIENKWNLKSYGFRTFTVAAPFLWNSLPLEIKSSPSLNIFKSKLKTHLFKCAFNLN